MTSRSARVSSAFYSPRLQKNIGFALVPIEHAEPGSEFTVRSKTGDVDARVVGEAVRRPQERNPEAGFEKGARTLVMPAGGST